MTLSDLLNAETVQIATNSLISWQDTIRLAAEPLIKRGKINQNYVDAMINVVEDNGPYINIGKNIALAHARPEEGAKAVSLALLKTPSINLIDENHPVSLWFVLSAVDNESHLDVIQNLMHLLTDQEKVDSLLQATTVSELLKVIVDS